MHAQSRAGISLAVLMHHAAAALKVNGADVLPAGDTMFELRLPHDVTVEYQKFRPWCVLPRAAASPFAGLAAHARLKSLCR